MSKSIFFIYSFFFLVCIQTSAAEQIVCYSYHPNTWYSPEIQNRINTLETCSKENAMILSDFTPTFAVTFDHGLPEGTGQYYWQDSTVPDYIKCRKSMLDQEQFKLECWSRYRTLEIMTLKLNPENEALYYRRLKGICEPTQVSMGEIFGARLACVIKNVP